MWRGRLSCSPKRKSARRGDDKKTLCVAFVVAASAVAVVLVMLFRCQEEHVATCCLAYGQNVGGTIHYAFENGSDSTAYDRLLTMRNVWLSPDFRSRVYQRVCVQCVNVPTNDIINTVSSVEVVLVRAKSPAYDLASVCARASSSEIVALAAVQGQESKKKGFNQLNRNCEKQERYVVSLRRKLFQFKAERAHLEASKIKEMENMLALQERTLAAMKADADKLQAENSWYGFFVEMDDDGEVTKIQ